MKKTKLITLLLALAVGLPAVTTAATAPAAKKEEEAPAVKIPATLAGIWQEIQKQQDGLSKTIAAKKLVGVHEFAFAIRDLVNALPDKSKLDAAKLATLKSNAKFVASLADRLDESGDANDQAGTEANFKKLQPILKTIEGLFPADALKADMGGINMKDLNTKAMPMKK